MAKNKLSRSQMKQLKQKITKNTNELAKKHTEIIKTIEEMNKSVYYGGEAANKWYKDADTSVTSNVNFIKQISLVLKRIDKQILKLEAASSGKGISSGSAATSNKILDEDGWQSEMELV